MANSSQKNVGKIDLETADKGLDCKRSEYLSLIDRLLELAYAKVQNRYCKNRERVAWIRAITGLVNAGASVLKDSDLDDLSRRLDRLERMVQQTKQVIV